MSVSRIIATQNHLLICALLNAMALTSTSDAILTSRFATMIRVDIFRISCQAIPIQPIVSLPHRYSVESGDSGRGVVPDMTQPFRKMPEAAAITNCNFGYQAGGCSQRSDTQIQASSAPTTINQNSAVRNRARGDIGSPCLLLCCDQLAQLLRLLVGLRAMRGEPVTQLLHRGLAGCAYRAAHPL